MNNQPPQFFLRFFRWFCHPRLQKPIEGDLMELYEERVKELGKRNADRRFRRDVIQLFRPSIIKPSDGTYRLNNYGMIKNYFKTSLRSILNQKSYSFINISGLTIGLLSSSFIFLWINDERKVDSFHDSSIHQVMVNSYYPDGKILTATRTPQPLLEVLKENYPEIKLATFVSSKRTRIIQVDDRYFKDDGIYVTPSFLEVFSFPLIVGDKHTALDKSNSVVISKELAMKYFGSAWRNANLTIGKTIKIGDKEDFIIAGIFENVPANSSFQFDFVAPIEAFIRENERIRGSWNHSMLKAYVTLEEGSKLTDFNEKIKQIIALNNSKHINSEVFLQKFSDRYLFSTYEDGVVTGGRIEYVRIFTLIAIFILVIACINFMNLTTARSNGRAKEIGVRKVMGAQKGSLRIQFLVETLVITSFAFLLTQVLTYLLLPGFNLLTDKQIIIDYLDPQYWAISLGMVSLTGLLSGSYPALFLSSLKIIQSLKGGVKHSKQAGFFRKSLVIFQFSISICLIIATMVVFNQVNYIQNKNLGMDRENLLQLDLQKGAKQNYETVKTVLNQMPGIASVSASVNNPLSVRNFTTAVRWNGKTDDQRVGFNIILAHFDFIETMKIELAHGRDYSKEISSDFSNVIINEAAARAMEMDTPIGESLSFWGREGRIIGVVKDFHFASMHSTIEPLIIRLDLEYASKLFIRTKPNQTKEALASLEKIYTEFDPGYPFDFQFLDDQFESMYKNETVVGKLAIYFSFVAISISCLGLFGLVSFTTQQRTKEIGIRKVLGASTYRLVTLLGNEFGRLVLISFCIAAPFAFYFSNNWLENFEYRIDLSPSVFLITGAFMLVIVGFTVGIKSYNTALRNPVDSLKDE
ncbi:MAG: ABC transporter permease [Ekhidna sp.]